MTGWYPLMLAQEGEAPSAPSAPSGPTVAPGGNPAAAPGQAVQGVPANPQAPVDQPPPPGSMMIFYMMFGMIGLFIVMSIMGNRREKKKREEMMASIKKGVRVQTAGGMLGTVMEVRDREVVVKVDEGSNTKIRFVRNAIHTVLQDKDKPDEDAKLENPPSAG